MIGMTVFRTTSHVFACLVGWHGGGGSTTALRQDKSRSLRPARPAADGRKISALARCALLHDSLDFGKSQATSALFAPRAVGAT